ncbi:hypothetical protein Emed_007401 [Eimeria media]
MWLPLHSSWFSFFFLFSHFACTGGSASTLPDSADPQLADSPWHLKEQESDPLSVTSDLGVWFNAADSEDPAALSRPNGGARLARLQDNQLNSFSGNVGLENKQGSQKPGLAQPRVLLPVAGALLVLVGALFAKHVTKERGSPPLASLLTGPPFPPASLNTAAQLARARARLHELNVSDEETWRLQKLKRGRFLHDSHAELYLSNLQDRLETGDEQLFAQTYIFSSWLQAVEEAAEFRPDALPELPASRLDSKQLRQCAAARFLLFPLKLPLKLPTEDKEGHTLPIVEEHYALGVIDRQHRLLRIVDSCKSEKELYALPLQHLKDLANELELQLREEGLIADEDLREFEPATKVPEGLGFKAHGLGFRVEGLEPGFASIDDPWSPSEWAKGVTAASGLKMLENAATIAEGRAPRKELGQRLALAETLWFELIMEESRSQWE